MRRLRKRKKQFNSFYLRKISQGTILTMFLLLAFLLFNRNLILGEILLHETIPHYPMDFKSPTLFKYDEGMDYAETEEPVVFMIDEDYTETEDEPSDERIFIVEKVEDIAGLENIHDVIGLNDVIYQPETDSGQTENHIYKEILTMDDIDQLRDTNNLRDKFYIVDRLTALTAEDFNVDRFLQTDLKIDNSGDGPKILIFHTHSNEMYSDSDPNNELDGVMGAGEKLAQILKDKYGIQTLHHMGRYDIEDGKSKILGAYERMEPTIRKILEDNPTIQVAIDLHRDGVSESTHLITDINGKPTAQLMFFNGLSKLMKDGELVAIDNLPNQYLSDNLAMSFTMQLTANKLYPNFTRKVYLNAYRYSNHMLPKSMLVEVGAQTNTKEEAFNAMEPLAEILADVIL